MKYEKIGENLYIKGRIGWKGLKKSEYLPMSEYRIINGQSISDNGTINWDKVGYISEQRYEESPEIMLKKNDIVITKDGTIGKIAKIDNLEKPTTVASGLFILRNERKDIFDTNYLYYYLLSSYFKNFIASRKEGSVIPHLYQRDFVNLEIPMYPLDIQKKIGEIVLSLDKKMKLNSQIISNLEEIASTLFKRWFVDFEFPDENGNPYKSSGGKMVDSELGEIPEGWNVGKIGELDIKVSDHVANGSFKSLKENVDILEEKSHALFLRNIDLKSDLRGHKRYVNEHTYNFLKKTQLFGGEVIISNVGDVGTVHIVPKKKQKMVLGNNQIFLDSASKNTNNYLYLLFKSYKGQELLKSITSGSVQMKFNKTDFRNLSIVVPSLRDFGFFSDILDNIQSLKNEISLLTELRDSLLPKLISGEIEISEDSEV